MGFLPRRAAESLSLDLQPVTAKAAELLLFFYAIIENPETSTRRIAHASKFSL